jgi:uncharacterized membrane protein YiaA
MTREVKYIIENKRFKRTWDDYLSYWEFVVPVLIFNYGLDLTARGLDPKDYFLGPLLIVVAFLLVKFILLRKRQLNEFEEIKNTLTQAENFEQVLKGLKILNVVEVDQDGHNWTINARYKSSLIPPVHEWLTIVCLDNRVLVNSRPTPATMLLWIRRSAMIDFKKTYVKSAAANNAIHAGRL